MANHGRTSFKTAFKTGKKGMGRDERNEIEGRGGEKSLKQNLFKGSRYRVMPLIASHSLCYSVTFDELW